MDRINKNLNALSIDPRNVIAPISEENITIAFVGKDQEGEVFQDKNGRFYEQKPQMDRDNAPDPLKRELILIIGITGEEEIKWIIDNSNAGSRIIIVEPNLGLLYDAINRNDLTTLINPRVSVAAVPTSQMGAVLENYLLSGLIVMASNIRVYSTYLYRNYFVNEIRKLVEIFSLTIKYVYFSLGNDVRDTLIGLENNLHNIGHMLESRDIGKLKGALQGYPAIVVASGPSLEKNIQYLRQAKNKALIIAADTILNRLLKEGIVPDVVASIERYPELYGYCYEGKVIPEEVALLAPLVITSPIFEDFKGTKLIPLRAMVRDNYWLNDTLLNLGEQNYLTMGASVAHLAFAFAVHTGASPIVLAGQDLAYGADGNQSHSGGTIYDGDVYGLSKREKVEVEGYYGGTVCTNRDWQLFKQWFELQLLKQPELTVINATEGGARINGTVEKPLEQVIQEYCRSEIHVAELLRTAPKYSLHALVMQRNLVKAKKELDKFLMRTVRLREKLEKIEITEQTSEQQLLAALKKMKEMDKIITYINEHNLLRHVLQPVIVNTFNNFYRIPEKLDYQSVRDNLKLQLDFLLVVNATTEKVVNILQRNIDNFDQYITA
ncbi:MAG: hypothetical protein H6Q75_1346 [Firmicutes bacterium]|nr:hypothetical protein [Bacillota bacterium]